jgi:polyphosphate kinase
MGDTIPQNIRLKDRDLSWLSFNHRVLQEAGDPTVPLYERIKFLAIFSSNIDEFFRVRVASLRALLRLKKKAQQQLALDPEALLRRILKVVDRQQEEFGDIYRSRIREDLKKQRIFLVREDKLDETQQHFARFYFRREVKPLLAPRFLSVQSESPFLENRHLYLAVQLTPKPPILPRKRKKKARNEFQYAIVEVPSDRLARFIQLPARDNRHYIAFLDDVIRLSLQEIFPNHDIQGAYAIKLTRDAELHIEDEFSGDLLQKIKKALGKRSKGIPSRFLYDAQIPKRFLALLADAFDLRKEDLVRGGRYHNFHDFFGLPNPVGAHLEYEPMPQVQRERLDESRGVCSTVRTRDAMVYYPYHGYEPVIRFLEEAADDPATRSIHVTLYRVAKESLVVEQLLRAARTGKDVVAFFEVKARFDEDSNIRWAEELERAGGRVLYSLPGLKVHAKLCLVTRAVEGGVERLAYLSTGNFNEKAARLYTDFGLFTADARVTSEIAQVFDILDRRTNEGRFQNLLVAPFNMRSRFEELIDEEIRAARNGEEAFLVAKMNSLQDPAMIAKLYEASSAGVRVSLLVRGICSLIPGVRRMSENIRVVSIVDRFLEHARLFWFHHGGEELMYLSSADWMERNLKRRIEVAFPVFDETIREELREILRLQLRDSVKGRLVNARQDNAHRLEGEPLRSQYAIYDYLRERR